MFTIYSTNEQNSRILAMFPRSYTSCIIHIWSPFKQKASWVSNKHAKEKGNMNEEGSMLSIMDDMLATQQEDFDIFIKVSVQAQHSSPRSGSHP